MCHLNWLQYIYVLKYFSYYNRFPKYIIDATANVGGNTLSFALHFNEVLSFEIKKETCKMLQSNVNFYNLNNAVVFLFN
jgi:tRNA/tmRNA/rRNA uracil-C5-methylase (TrmA/RlmC/RlmD family)